jgi:hypothetical protein
MRRALATLFCLAATGCGTDPLLGTYSFTSIGEHHTTSPRDQRDAVQDQGTFAITTRASGEYLLTIAATNFNCVLNVDHAPGGLHTVLPGQHCTVNFTGGTADATITNGTMGSGGEGNVLITTLNYTYTGTLLGVRFDGIGNQTLVGNRR